MPRSLIERLQEVDGQIDPRGVGGTRTEWLPFTVRPVRSELDREKALRVRVEGYARHLPEFARTLRELEPMDTREGVVVFLAESKLDGSALGTMRVQSNHFLPLALEQSVELPQYLRNSSLAEATRLAVARDRVGTMVKNLLFKAYFHYCQSAGVDWMVVAGRCPIDRQYAKLLFDDVWPGQGYIPLKHAGDLPHRIMCFEVASAEERWRAAGHPLYDFIFRTVHPDLDCGSVGRTEVPVGNLPRPQRHQLAAARMERGRHS